jgi:hypothetical protein
MPHSIYGRKKQRAFAPRPDPAALHRENRLKPVESGAGPMHALAGQKNRELSIHYENNWRAAPDEDEYYEIIISV